MVSVGGNLYSVPDCTRKRAVEVHTLADEIRIFEAGRLIASHPVLDGRGQRRVAVGHRLQRSPGNSPGSRNTLSSTGRPGEIVACRSLAFYDAVGKRLAAGTAPP
jgi:hypothetical protein